MFLASVSLAGFASTIMVLIEASSANSLSSNDLNAETRLMDPLRLPIGINLAQHSVSSKIESHSNGSGANWAPSTRLYRSDDFAASKQPVVHSSTDISSSFPLPIHNEQLQPVATPTQEQPLANNNSSSPAPNSATNNSHDEHIEIAVIDSSTSVPNTVANGDDEHT
ncbi:hypothetical protein V6N11_054869 [Hibiscus sabdariffa]|uniref:Uncharacterized protein n=1 Tax=Hibiscus sabdariffa TaxID=183260 RepID=A0ABR2P369_9ROSI